jgi:citrate lyase subunit beta / citryl-CoA lyase
MPGANERALEKARTLPADALILDLEESVAPEAKVRAREQVCDAARSAAYGERAVAIRVNGIETEWYEDDLAAASRAGPDAILVPKVGSAEDVLSVERGLELAGAPARTRIWVMLETPIAVLRAAEIASASERLEVLVMGTNDLLKELYAETVPGRAPLQTSLALCLLAARAAACSIVDGVYNDIRDSEGFESECVAARVLGFDGKTLIHPGQIDICNRVFSPSDEDVEQARRVIEAFEAAIQAGSGVATLEGRLIERLHVDSAMRVLSLAGEPTPST